MNTFELDARAVFAWDARDAAALTLHALRRACDPEQLTVDRLADYCEQTALGSARFERAVLHEALGMVSPGELAGRLAAAMPRQARRDSLGVRVRGTARDLGDHVLARIRSSAIERELAIRRGEPPRLAAPSPVAGHLVVEGTIRSDDRSEPAIAAWQVGPDRPLDVAADACTPGRALTALAGQVAMTRLADAFAWRLRALLDRRCRPTLLGALRRPPTQIRAYLLYWRRLRDYVVWRALHDV
jgi:hypothetical protein